MKSRPFSPLPLTDLSVAQDNRGSFDHHCHGILKSSVVITDSLLRVGDVAPDTNCESEALKLLLVLIQEALFNSIRFLAIFLLLELVFRFHRVMNPD